MNFCSRHPISRCVHALYRVFRRGEPVRASHPRPAVLQQALAEIGLNPDSIAISAEGNGAVGGSSQIVRQDQPATGLCERLVIAQFGPLDETTIVPIWKAVGFGRCLMSYGVREPM